MSETIRRQSVGEEPQGQQDGRRRHIARQLDNARPRVEQVDNRRRRKKKEPKLSGKERRKKRKQERMDFRRRWAADLVLATEVFTDLVNKGEAHALTLTNEKGRPISKRHRRKAALEYTRGALDGYDFATIAADTSSASDQLQLERVIKRIESRNDNHLELVSRVGDVTSVVERASALLSDSETWDTTKIKEVFRSSRRYYKHLSRPQRRVFDE